MVKSILGSWLLSTIILSSENSFTGEMSLFGTRFQWKAAAPIVDQRIGEEFESLSRWANYALDPECLWRAKDATGNCPQRYQAQTEKIVGLSSRFQHESGGVFNSLRLINEKYHLDFGGVWQGLAVDHLKERVSGAWELQYSNDFFSNHQELRKLQIHLPHQKDQGWGQVEMTSGFMMSFEGVSKNNRAKASGSSTQEVAKLWLFAPITFSGARLDAWGTAIVSGGLKTLKRLESLKDYQGRWDYIYLTGSGHARCSDGLNCDLRSFPRKISYLSKRSPLEISK